MTEPQGLDLSFLQSGSRTDLSRAEETPDDTGNGFRFARLCGHQVRYLAAEKIWLVWDGTRLARDDRGHAFHLTGEVVRDVRNHGYHVPEDQRPIWQRWATASASAGHRDAMLRVAATLPELSIGPLELDATPYYLNTVSGTVDLRDGSIKAHDLNDRLTHATSVPYDPQIAWTPLLVEFMQTFMPDPSEWLYLMKVIGATLLAGNPFRVWLILHGPTTTGKTQFVEKVARLLGDYAVSVNPSVFRANLDDRPRPDLLRALTARLVYAMEGSSSWELHGDHLKRMTGEDPIVARGMHSGTMVERIPDFTPLIVCNSYPRLKGNADQAVRRRLQVLPFTFSVLGEEDPAKREKFSRDEATGIALLTQLVDGCRRALAEGLIHDLPQRWAESTFNAFGELNNVADFLNWLRDTGLLVEIHEATFRTCWQVADLYARYTSWLALYGSAEDRRGALGLRQFNAELRSLGWESHRADGVRWIGKVRLEPVPVTP